MRSLAGEAVSVENYLLLSGECVLAARDVSDV